MCLCVVYCVMLYGLFVVLCAVVVCAFCVMYVWFVCELFCDAVCVVVCDLCVRVLEL